jgi:hypothetical protein
MNNFAGKPEGSSRRRKVVAIGLGLALAGGLTAASAATLGGITARSLGSDVAVVASCDANGVAAAFTEVYQAAAPSGFRTSAVQLSGIATTCAGLTITAVLTGAAGVSLAQGTVVMGAAPATTATVTFVTPPESRLVTGVAIVIT